MDWVWLGCNFLSAIILIKPNQNLERVSHILHTWGVGSFGSPPSLECSSAVLYLSLPALRPPTLLLLPTLSNVCAAVSAWSAAVQHCRVGWEWCLVHWRLVSPASDPGPLHLRPPPPPILFTLLISHIMHNAHQYHRSVLESVLSYDLG